MATYSVSGEVRGSTVRAVSIFSVLAGARCTCEPFWASTSPVSASARIHVAALTSGRGSAPGWSSTVLFGLASRSPPRVSAAGRPVAEGGGGHDQRRPGERGRAEVSTMESWHRRPWYVRE